MCSKHGEVRLFLGGPQQIVHDFRGDDGPSSAFVAAASAAAFRLCAVSLSS
jgi:hypothetical protein